MGVGGGGAELVVSSGRKARGRKGLFFSLKCWTAAKKGPRDSSGWKAFGGSQYTVSGFGIAWSRAGTTFHLFQDRRYAQDRRGGQI